MEGRTGGKAAARFGATREERIIDQLPHAPLVPEQMRARRALQSEQVLMVAVLEDAITCVQRAAEQSRTGFEWNTTRVQRETVAWFAATDYRWPFSFVRICEAVGLDPGRIREKLAIAGRAEAAA